MFTLALYNNPLTLSNSTLDQRLAFQGSVFLLSTLVLILVAALTHSLPSYSREALVILLLNGARVGFVYALYAEALKRLHPILVASLVALEVPLTMVFEYYWLGQVQRGPVLFGTALILLGIACIILENDRFRPRDGDPRIH